MLYSLLSLLFTQNALAVPLQMNHQGRLLDTDGNGLEGEHELIFRIMDDPEDGYSLYTETLTIDFNNGYYSLILGADEEVNPLDDTVFANYPLYLALKVDGENLEPRHPLTSVPYAQIAGVSESVDGGMVNASEINIGGQPVIDSDGNWVGNAQAVDFVDLTNTPSGLDDGDDDLLSEIACSIDELISWDGQYWVCVSDSTLELSDIEDMLLNNPLDLHSATTIGGLNITTSIDDSDTLADLMCQSDGQIVRYDLSNDEWFCDDENTLNGSDIVAAVNGQTINLGLGTQVSSSDVVTANSFASHLPTDLLDGDDNTQLDQTAVVGFINGQAMNLGSGSQVDSDDIVTASDFYNLLPSDLADGDSDALSSLVCSQGEIPSWDGLSSWICTSDNTLDENTVETFITNDLIDLYAGSQVDGSSILTSTSTLDWNNVINAPSSGGASISTSMTTLTQNQEHVITPTGSAYMVKVEFLDPEENIWLTIPEQSSSGLCDICGDGSDGDYLAFPIDSPSPIQVTLASGAYNFSSFTIPSNVIVDVTGTDPLYINVQGKVEIRGTLNLSGADAQCSYGGSCPGGVAGAGGSDGGNGGQGSQVPSTSGVEMDWNRTDLFFGENFQGGTGGDSNSGRYHSSWYTQCNHFGAAGGGGGGAVKVIAQSIEILTTNGIDVSGGESIADSTQWDNACGTQGSGQTGHGGSIWMAAGNIELQSDALDIIGSTDGNVRIDNSNRISYDEDFYRVNSNIEISDFGYYSDTNGNIIVKNNVFDTVDLRITTIEN